MSLVRCPEIFYPPGLYPSLNDPSITVAALTTTAQKGGYIFEAPKSGTITRIGFRMHTVTTGGDLDVRVETIAASGEPSGTLWAANTNATQTVQDTDDGVWFWTTLTAGAVVQKHDILCVVIAWVSGNMQLVIFSTSLPIQGSVPTAAAFTGGAWGFNATGAPNLALEYSDGSRPPWNSIPRANLGAAWSTKVFNTGSSPDEVGVRFRLPYNCKVGGVWHKAYSAITGHTYALRLYDENDALMEDRAGIDIDLDHSGPWTLHFPEEQIIQANRVYRVTILPESASDITIAYCQVDSSPTLEAMPGGRDWFLTERADAGGWTNQEVQVPLMGIVISALDDGITSFPPVHFGPGIIR